jgi:hypothetical protein
MTVIRETAYTLRTCKADMTSHAGFIWPRRGWVEAPDWKPTKVFGNGLHGFLNGEGDGFLADWSPDAVWLVARIEEYVDLGGKVKFPRAKVMFAGSREDATQKIHKLYPGAAVIGISLTGGDGSTLTGGHCSTLTGGDGSTLTGGHRSTLTGGHRSTLTGGDGSTLTGGHRSTLTGGDGSTLTGGHRSTLTGGHRSTLCIWWHDGTRRRLAVAYVGEGGIKPDTPYRIDDSGNFVEATWSVLFS